MGIQVITAPVPDYTVGIQAGQSQSASNVRDNFGQSESAGVWYAATGTTKKLAIAAAKPQNSTRDQAAEFAAGLRNITILMWIIVLGSFLAMVVGIFAWILVVRAGIETLFIVHDIAGSLRSIDSKS